MKSNFKRIFSVNLKNKWHIQNIQYAVYKNVCQMTADVPGVINKPKSLTKFLQHLEKRMQILVTQMPI